MENRRRLIYLTGVWIGLPAIILIWLAQRTVDPFVAFGYPLLALLVLSGAFVVYRWPDTLPRVEKAMLVVVGALLLSRMAYVQLTVPLTENAWLHLGPTVYMNLVVWILFANMVMLPRKALWASFTLILMSAALGLTRFIPEALSVAGNAGLVALMRHEVYLLVIAIFIFVLAKSKDDHYLALLDAKRLQLVAQTDALTGLPNRLRLDQELQRALEVAGRHDRPLALIMFDLDQFKKVNDRHGHLVGDEVLQEVAVMVRPLLRRGDLLGRWGGEEFLIVAPETNLEQARNLAERIRRRFETHVFPRSLKVTASFGVAAGSGQDSNAELYERVDRLLYDAKRSGRNQVS